MTEHDVPNWFIESCSKIGYMFPKAHALNYAQMVWRQGFFKVYYPMEFEEEMELYRENHPMID